MTREANMARYSVRRGVPGEPFKGRVYDTFRNEITSVFFCDKETGEVGRFFRDDTGRYVVKNGALVTVWEIHPAPLIVVPFIPDDDPAPLVVEAARE